MAPKPNMSWALLSVPGGSTCREPPQQQSPVSRLVVYWFKLLRICWHEGLAAEHQLSDTNEQGDANRSGHRDTNSCCSTDHGKYDRSTDPESGELVNHRAMHETEETMQNRRDKGINGKPLRQFALRIHAMRSFHTHDDHQYRQ
ncbi:MAG: hypothetical protein RLZZ336_1226 [Cyanobacteriota bacterium]